MLMSDAQDRRLFWFERAALRGHLVACRVCPNLKKQFGVISQAAKPRSKSGGDAVAPTPIEAAAPSSVGPSGMEMGDRRKADLKEQLRRLSNTSPAEPSAEP